jgi:hypothetical protein
MRDNGAERDRRPGRKKKRKLVDVLDQNIRSFGGEGAPDRTAAPQCKAVSTADPANVDAVQGDSFRGTLPA